jgi:hypothetical protein
MSIFASEYVLKPLMEDSRSGREYFQLIFDGIAMKVEAVMWSTSFFLFLLCAELILIHTCQGVVPVSNRMKPLTGARSGTKVHGRIISGSRNFDFLDNVGFIRKKNFLTTFFKFSNCFNFLIKIATGLLSFAFSLNKGAF